MTGHRKEITSLSIHSSGKLALSTSRDSTLRIWDLIKGRCSYHHILDAVAETVAFSPSGALYALVSGSKVTVHQIGLEAGLVGELPHDRRVLCIAWHQDYVILTGTEAGSIHAWDITSSTQICEKVKAHQTRIRGLVVDISGAPLAKVLQDKAGAQCTVASAATDGTVKTWSFDTARGADALQPLSELATGARLTCLTLVRPIVPSTEAIAVRKQAKVKQQKSQRRKLADKDSLAPQQARVSKIKKMKTKAKAAGTHAAQVAKPDVKRTGVVENGVVDFTDAAVRAHAGPSGANSVQLGKKGGSRKKVLGKIRRQQ